MIDRIARLTVVAIGAACVLAPIGRARAQGSKPTVAVMLFNNDADPRIARDYDGLSKAIADFLTSEMSTNSNLRVIDRAQVQTAIDAQRLPVGARMTREAAMAAAKSVGAQKVIVGRFAPDAQGNFRIDAREVDVASGAVEFTDRLQDRADNIVPLVGQLASRLYGGLGLPAPTNAPAGGTGTRLPMRGAITYGQALDAADHGQRARAAELYGAVLKDYPDYEPAKRGLARLKPGA
jgi:TolB-like protein